MGLINSMCACGLLGRNAEDEPPLPPPKGLRLADMRLTPTEQSCKGGISLLIEAVVEVEEECLLRAATATARETWPEVTHYVLDVYFAEEKQLHGGTIREHTLAVTVTVPAGVNGGGKPARISVPGLAPGCSYDFCLRASSGELNSQVRHIPVKTPELVLRTLESGDAHNDFQCDGESQRCTSLGAHYSARCGALRDALRSSDVPSAAQNQKCPLLLANVPVEALPNPQLVSRWRTEPWGP